MQNSEFRIQKNPWEFGKRQLTFSLQLKLQLFASCIYQFVGACHL